MDAHTFSGDYFSTFGALRLDVRAGRISGHYPLQGGSLEGVVDGQVARGTWKQSGNKREGDFWFEFDPHVNSFNGGWRYRGEDAYRGQWNGVRVALPSAADGGFPGGDHSYASGPLLAGPLLGEVGEQDAIIWAQARDTSPLTLVIGSARGEQRIQLTPRWEDWLCVKFRLEGLANGCTYSLESAHGRTPAFPLRLALPRAARQAKISLGSCFHYHCQQDLPIFSAIRAMDPDVFVMLGDNTYFTEPDWQSEHTMMRAYLRARNNDSLRPLVASVPTVGVFDDHDFGPNDCDATFVGKPLSQRVLSRCFAQRHYGTPEVPGIFSSVRMGPAEIFLLDSRSYRYPSTKSLLGTGQLQWLVDSLTQSDAPVKIIASPSQALAGHVVVTGYDGFRHDAPDELETLLGEIEARSISGVVFVSGDLHMAHLHCQKGRDSSDAQGPDFWELTTSPLANDPWNETLQAKDPYMVREVIDQNNFGLVDIDLDREGAEIILSARAPDGRALIEQAVPLATLTCRRLCV